MGLRAPESKNGDHFFTRTPPQNGGLGICFMCLPRKVIFGHFIDFEYFGSDFSCFYIVKEIKTSNGHTKAIYGSIMLKFFLWAPITQWHHICRRQNVTQKKSFCGTPYSAGWDDKYSDYSSVENDNQMTDEKRIIILTVVDSYQNYKDLS